MQITSKKMAGDMDEPQDTLVEARKLKRAYYKQAEIGKKFVKCEPRPLYFFPESDNTLNIDTKHGIPVRQCPQRCGACNYTRHECLPTTNFTYVRKLVNLKNRIACVEVREDIECKCGELTKERESELKRNVLLQKTLNDSTCMDLVKLLLGHGES